MGRLDPPSRPGCGVASVGPLVDGRVRIAAGIAVPQTTEEGARPGPFAFRIPGEPAVALAPQLRDGSGSASESSLPQPQELVGAPKTGHKTDLYRGEMRAQPYRHGYIPTQPRKGRAAQAMCALSTVSCRPGNAPSARPPARAPGRYSPCPAARPARRRSDCRRDAPLLPRNRGWSWPESRGGCRT